MAKVSGPVDDLLVVETPERVELHFPLASLGNRFLACAIDHTIQLVIFLLLLLIGDFLDQRISRAGLDLLTSLEKVNAWVRAVGILLIFIIFFGYFILFESLWNGQTPGKRWMRLRVIQQDGRPVTFFAIMLRNIIRLADMVIPPFYSIGLVTIFASRHSKRLGDFVANTVVIKEWRGEWNREGLSFDRIFLSEVEGTPEGPAFARVEFEGPLEQITPAEILIAEICLRRCQQLPPAPREWLAWRVATPLLEKIRPVFNPEGFTYEGFLRELLMKVQKSGAGRAPLGKDSRVAPGR